jgi:hypothetical protein
MSEKDFTKAQHVTDVDELSVSETTVYINVIVDTREILNRYSNNRSTNPNSPTQIKLNDVKECIYMVATRDDVISGHGGSDLKVQVFNQDHLRWTATSETQNSDCTVTLYNITHYTGDTIIKDQKYDPIMQKVFVPSDTEPTKGTIDWRTFPGMYANTKPYARVATENYYFSFSIYAREHGQDPYLFGYFQIDPSIQINK